MSSIARRPNGAWRARYRDTTGQEHARHFTRRSDAQLWLAQQVTRVADGTWVDPQAGRRTLGTYVQAWIMDQVQHRPGTIANTRRRLDNHVLPTFGHRALSTIRRGEIQAWVRALTAKGLAPSYVQGLYRLLGQVMRAAVADRLLPASPCTDVNLPASVASRVQIPTPDQVATIVRVLPVEWAGPVLVAVGSGLRLQEVLGLGVDRVDFLRGSIVVDRQLHTDTGRFGPPKTASSCRTVPVAREVIDVIAGAVTPGIDLVFRSPEGTPWGRARWRNTWAWRVREKAGLTVRFHDLRHLYASTLIAAGQSAKVVQERLGHASISETFDTYGHLFPEDEEGTRVATGPLVEMICGLVADRG